MRQKINLNQDWLFFRAEEQPVSVNLPHTWNAEDGTDGGNDYYRGTCLYRREFKDPRTDTSQEVFLELEGAAMSCEVFVNNRFAGFHEGGYSTVHVALTSLLQEDNLLEIRVDNSANEYLYPQKADFTFYGGLYRPASLIITDKSHFALEPYGTYGLEVSYDLDLENKTARVHALARVNNAEEKTVFFSLDDAEIQKETPVHNGTAQADFDLDSVHLWDGKNDPYLYKMSARLDNGDEVQVRFGIRHMAVDPDLGFLLNGRPYRLCGVSRHQDRDGLGNALTYKEHEEDLEIIMETGANSVRLAHYQHAQDFYDLCDQYGIIVWAEIPYITRHMKDGVESTVSMMKELITQNKPHPSIMCWGLSNEITAHGGWNEEIQKNHEILQDLVHKMDPSRFTTMAHVFMLDTANPFARFADVNSYNLYYGWYVGELEQNDAFFDAWHQNYPQDPIGLSEFGADANPAYQAAHPVKGDWSEGYQALYHEHMLKMWSERPWIWCMFVWNMFDFGADGRDEGGKPGQNQKGLVTFDRKTRKDAFYIYKAYLSDEPFVHICGRRYAHRPEEVTEIKVYCNQPEVSLYVDGRLTETTKGDKVFRFDVPISGKHSIKAKAGSLEDEICIQKTDKADPAYQKEGSGVTNWFDREDEIAREGYYSILDSMADLKANPLTAELLAEIVEAATASYGEVAQGVEMPEEIQRQMDAAPLQSMLMQASQAIKPEMVKTLNARLNDIPKA